MLTCSICRRFMLAFTDIWRSCLYLLSTSARRLAVMVCDGAARRLSATGESCSVVPVVLVAYRGSTSDALALV